jgi:hypothetical protein
MNFFEILTCEFISCPNYYTNHCFFDQKYIPRWLSAVENLKINPRCQMLQQVRLYKTKELIRT